MNPLPVKTWEQFKKYVKALDRKRYIFRGQEDREWRLRTSFYRTGRACLEKYLLNDVSELQKALSALTRHPFNLNDLMNPLIFAGTHIGQISWTNDGD